MSNARDLLLKASKKLSEQPEAARAVGATYRLEISGAQGGTWLLRLTDTPSLTEEDAPAPCTLRLSAEDLVLLLQGQAEPQALFFSGRLVVDGDITLALRLPAVAALLS